MVYHLTEAALEEFYAVVSGHGAGGVYEQDEVGCGDILFCHGLTLEAKAEKPVALVPGAGSELCVDAQGLISRGV